MEGSHQEINVLEGQVVGIAQEFIGGSSVKKIHTLPYAVIGAENIINASFLPYFHQYRGEKIA